MVERNYNECEKGLPENLVEYIFFRIKSSFIPEGFALANKPDRLLINGKRDVKALRAWLGTLRRLMPKSFTQKFWMHFTNTGPKLEIFTQK